MSEDDWAPVITAAHATLEDLDNVIGQVNEAIRQRVEQYALVSDAALTAATSRNISSLLTALAERRHLSHAELDGFAATVEQRARDGVPVDEYLLAVSTAEAFVWEQVLARGSDIVESRRAEAFAIRFANMNAITRATVSAHRRIELVIAREDQERRGLALRALVRGGLSLEDAREHLARLGLGTDGTYHVVRARARGPLDSDQIPRSLSERPSATTHFAFVLWGEDTVGLLRERPVTADHVTAGVSAPVSIADLPEAHQHATVAFETAWHLGMSGTFDLAALGLKAAVQASPEVGRVLRDRYLTPLFASGKLGNELLSTTRAFLESGSRRDVAAAKLFLHQNTVGYRLSRFTEITGADLTDLTTVAELHWLFTDLDLRPVDPSG